MVGIGGAGMSGIAEVLLNLGFVVTGSDLQLTDVTDRLAKIGAHIFEGHSASNISDADVIVFSSAVKPENQEIRAARAKSIPQIPRSEMLAELMRLKIGIAISGTHGKTTTTSMTGAILDQAGLNPTLIVGGIVRSLHSGIKMGTGDLLVVEADEFDRSFLKLTPTLAVITTIEAEHLDTYTDLAGVQDAFVEFANRVPFYGSVIVCEDDLNTNAILPRIRRPITAFGLAESSRFRAVNVKYFGSRSSFQMSDSGKIIGKIELQIPGRHNVLNALAAATVGRELDISFENIRIALENFTGVHRRFEIIGETNGIIVVDDYAHHPTEVLNTLKTARQCWPDRRIVALFQPHLYSRTRDFAAEFASSLAVADVVLLADIYPARERPIAGVTSDLIIEALKTTDAEDFSLVGKPDSIEAIRAITRPNDVLVVMGAGTITRVARDFMH